MEAMLGARGDGGPPPSGTHQVLPSSSLVSSGNVETGARCHGVAGLSMYDGERTRSGYPMSVSGLP